MRKTSLIAALLAAATPAMAEELTVGVENLQYLPHYTVENGEYAGFGRAVLDAFAADTGHTLVYEPLPVNRLFKGLVEGKVDLKYPDNSYWSTDLKDGKNVVYSEPVVTYVDGVNVLPERVGQGAENIETLGLVTGFTAWAWKDRIDSGASRRSENADFEALVKQTLAGRVDGAYANTAVVAYQLDRMGQDGALVFDADLPHTRDTYHLSTTTHPEVIEEFNAWMAANPEKLAELKAEYGVGEE